MRRGLALALVAAAVVAALVVAEALSGSAPARRARTAPALPAAVLVPPRMTVASLTGKPAVITFWASWCDPCRREAAELARFATAAGGRARLVGVDWSDSESGARAFIRRYRWRFPNLRDSDGTAGDAYGITGLPTTFVLDAHGRVKAKLAGPQTVESLTRAIG